MSFNFKNQDFRSHESPAQTTPRCYFGAIHLPQRTANIHNSLFFPIFTPWKTDILKCKTFSL